MTRRYVMVHGTGDRHPRWIWPDSPLRRELARHRWQHVEHAEGGFAWSGDVGRLFWIINRHDWEVMGDALRFYCRPVRDELGHLILISHSHGAQGVVAAATKGLQVDLWIDISGPIREDILARYPEARPQIARHVFVYDASRWGDWTRILGQLFDGRLAIPLAHPYADVNLPIAGAGHSRVLTDPAYLREWGRRILPAATGSGLV